LWGEELEVHSRDECGVSSTEAPSRSRQPELFSARVFAHLPNRKYLHDISILDEIALQEQDVSIIDTKQRTHLSLASSPAVSPPCSYLQEGRRN
jgi:hypothetical protein